MVDNFILEITNNLQVIGVAFGIFIIAVLANMVASCYHNTHALKENFSTAKLFDGIAKMLSIGITTALLAVIATALPFVLDMASVTMEEGVKEIYTVGAVLALYGKGILKYYKEAYQTENDIMENGNIIEDLREE